MFQLKKISDEGTSEPFIARLWIGVPELRDHALNSYWSGTDLEKHREEFDTKYEPVFTALRTCREAASEVVTLVSDHSAKVTSGAIVEFQPSAVSFRENIDLPLHQATTRLLVNGVIALKGLQEVTKIFNIDIGSLFQNKTKFEEGLTHLSTTGHPALERYLREARQTWTESFNQQRVDFEHAGWTLPAVKYIRSGQTSFQVSEPTVCNLPVSEFARLSVRRLLSFVENNVVYVFKVSLSDPLIIVEIPPDERDSSIPRRFQLYLKGCGKPEWLPRYNDGDFQ